MPKEAQQVPAEPAICAGCWSPKTICICDTDWGDKSEFDEDANDQPTTCEGCGSRSEFTTDPDGTEHHKCLTCSHTWEQDELGYITPEDALPPRRTEN